MSVRNQTVIKLQLEAGVPITRDIGCEFIYIEQGRSLTVRAGGSRLTGRRRGDKIRLDGVVSSITVESDEAQLIELVVGFGEFERIIVEGELSLAEVVKTSTFETKNLPFEVTKEYGLINSDYVSFSQDAQINSVADGTTYPASANSLYAYDGNYIYMVAGGASGKLRVLDPIDLTQISVVDLNIAYANAGAEWYGARGLCAAYGRLYLWTTSYLYRVNPVTGDGYLIHSFAGATALGFPAGFVRDGLMYIPRSVGGYAAVVDPLNGDALIDANRQIFLGGSVQYVWLFDDIDDVLWAGSSGATTLTKFNNDGAGGWVSAGVSRNFGFLANVGFAMLSDYGKYVSRDYSGNDVSHASESVEYSGRLYVQEVGDISTRREYYIQGDYSWAPTAGGDVVMIGEIAKALMSGLNAGKLIKDNYRDYLISAEYRDEKNSYVKNAGSQSWAYRGLRDYGRLLLPSQATLKVMPEFLTDAF